MRNTFGPHLIIDGKKCDRDKLTNRQLVYDVLNKLPSLIGMTKIKDPDVLEYLDKFAKIPGYTGVVILAESHISIHTFPDFDYIFIDIFSCRYFDVEKAKDYLIRTFGIKEFDINLVERGIDFNKQTLNIKSISN